MLSTSCVNGIQTLLKLTSKKASITEKICSQIKILLLMLFSILMICSGSESSIKKISEKKNKLSKTDSLFQNMLRTKKRFFSLCSNKLKNLTIKSSSSLIKDMKKDHLLINFKEKSQKILTINKKMLQNLPQTISLCQCFWSLYKAIT